MGQMAFPATAERSSGPMLGDGTPLIANGDTESMAETGMPSTESQGPIQGSCMRRLVPAISVVGLITLVVGFACMRNGRVQLNNIDANANVFLSVAREPLDLKCKDAEESLYKIKDMVRLHTKRSVLTREQQLAANDILAGNVGETTLENIEDFLDNITVDDMSLLGEAITADDMQRITNCMLNEDVDLSSEEMEADSVEADPDSVQLSAYNRPNPHQKFCFHSSCKNRCKTATRRAARSIEEQIPCISLREANCGRGVITIRADKPGCFYQRFDHHINLARGCQTKSTAEHEILHSFGMAHEQQRLDRDQFINIHWQNMKGSMKHNFKKTHEAFTGNTYDILSVMHYPRHAFSRNGLDTITAKKSHLTRFIGQRVGLSELDARQMCLQYGCKATCNPENKNEARLKVLLDRRLVVLQNPKTGKCLDIAGKGMHDGSNLVLYDCHKGFNQHWELTNNGLRNPTTGKCVDISGFGKMNVHLWKCHGGRNQKWEVRRDGTVRNPASNKCLDIGFGNNVLVWSCHGAHNQIWRLKDL